MMRYFVGFILTIGLIVLLIIMLLSSGGEEQPKTSTEQKPLTSYASTDAEAILTIDGTINATSNHDSVRITVGRDQVVYEQIKGYDGQVVKEKRFDNSENSYEVFLNALAQAGFTQGDTDAALRNEKGMCPLGSRYIYELVEDSRDIQRFWATSCGGVQSYKGEAELTRTLFQEQIPGFDDLVADLSIDT